MNLILERDSEFESLADLIRSVDISAIQVAVDSILTFFTWLDPAIDAGKKKGQETERNLENGKFLVAQGTASWTDKVFTIQCSQF